MKKIDKVGSMFLRGDVDISLGVAGRFAKALEMDFIPTLVPKMPKPQGTKGALA